MKDYGCCPKFKRGDNSTYTFTKKGGHVTATVFLHAHLQVVYYNYVKFHENSISSLVGVALTRYTLPLFVNLVSTTPPKRLIGVL
jgi:hypothetical protein